MRICRRLGPRADSFVPLASDRKVPEPKAKCEADIEHVGSGHIPNEPAETHEAVSLSAIASPWRTYHGIVTAKALVLRRDASALVAGTVVNGLSIYVVAAVGTRAYGPETFAPVSVLWTFWAVSAAVLTFPLQHWVIHRVEADGHEGGVRSSLPTLGSATLMLAVILAIAAWIGRSPLFGDDRLVWPALVALLTVVAALTGLVRGVLASRRRFVATAVAIGSENLIRLLAGLTVVALGGSEAWYGVALLSGVLVVGMWPSVVYLHGPQLRVPLAGYLGGLAGGTVLAQIALTSGPAVLSAIGGAAASVTGLFVTMALFRAPYLMSLGVANMITGPLTALTTEGNRPRLRRLLLAIGVATVALAVLAGAGAYVVGPSLVDLVFGRGTSPPRFVVALVAAGSALALGTLATTLMAIAGGRTGLVAAWWAVALAVAALVLLRLMAEPSLAVAAAFLTAQTAAFISMAAFQLGALRS
jgi:O-antigen/teichoic acid export membrane protein